MSPQKKNPTELNKYQAKGPDDYMKAAGGIRGGYRGFRRRLIDTGDRELPHLSSEQVKTLFDISNDYVRTDGAVRMMKRDKLSEDLRRRLRLINRLQETLRDVERRLRAARCEKTFQETARLARLLGRGIDTSISKTLNCLQAIEPQGRAVYSNAQKHSLQTPMHEYVAELDHYIDHAFNSTLPVKRKEVTIAAVMTAASVFSKKQASSDPVANIAMARSRARQHLKKAFHSDDDDGPVFRSSPRKATSVY